MESPQLPIMLSAVYDEISGEILIAHPTEANVFVNPSHYKEIKSNLKKDATGNKSLSNMQDIESNCVYTESEVCVNGRWVPPGIWLCDRVRVRTCKCN